MPTTRIVKTRRTHKKSRNGCIECKNRHIRCDERKPSCANCDLVERTCIFPPRKVGKQQRNQGRRRQEQEEQRVEAITEPINLINIDVGHGVDTDSPHTQLLPLYQQADDLLLDQDLIAQSFRSFRVNAPPFRSSSSSLQLGDICTPPTNSCPGLSYGLDATLEATFTSQHMVLLRHADKVPSFTEPHRSIVDIAISRAVDSPYFLEEVLAFTAFYMTHLYPGSADHLRHLATELQTRALTSFSRLTKIVPNDDQATAVPRFLFSAILGRHVLAETLANCRADFCRSDFNSFIDRFVECFNLNRGVRAVTPPARNCLYNSEIQPYLKPILDAEKNIKSAGPECDPLNRLMDASDLSKTSAEACRQAIAVLQQSFDICRNVDVDEYPQAASVFSVTIGHGFVEVLRKHRPEGLIILAYYGVLLHYCRNFWAFGDTGASMIRAIVEHVGSYWQEALAWPLHVLETDRDVNPLDLPDLEHNLDLGDVTSMHVDAAMSSGTLA